jgi:hypothetical protein
MKYSVGVGSGSIIRIGSLIKIVSGIENLRSWDTHTDTWAVG